MNIITRAKQIDDVIYNENLLRSSPFQARSVDFGVHGSSSDCGLP